MAKEGKEKSEANGPQNKNVQNEKIAEKEKSEPKKVPGKNTSAAANGKAGTSGGGKKSLVAAYSGPKQSDILSQLAKNMSDLASEVKSMKAAQMNPPAGPSGAGFDPNYFPQGAYGYGYEECDYGDVADGYDQNYDDPNYPPEVISAGRGQALAQSKQTPANGDGTETDRSGNDINMINVEKEEGELDPDIVDKYDKFLAEFVTPKEETVGPVDGGLASGINSMFKNGMDNEVFKKKVAAIKRPKNMTELCDVKVDSQVLALLKHQTKNFDSRLKSIQTAVMKAGCCLTQLVDSIQNNADALALAGGDNKVDEWTTL